MLNYVCKQIAINCVQLTFNEIEDYSMFFYVIHCSNIFSTDKINVYKFKFISDVFRFILDDHHNSIVFLVDFNGYSLNVTNDIFKELPYEINKED